jgi:pilus assembly protein FimV
MSSNNRCKTSVCASAVLAVASLGFSPASWALGLGDARVESYLNQPLQVRIDLISQASDDLTSVTARLASAADYELIGASREAVAVPIGFSIEDIDGDAYILATSNLPISEPVLRLIVEVSWSSGRMLREYTLFLDPPAVPEPAPAPRIDQRQPAAAPAAAAVQPTEVPTDQATEQPGDRPAAQAPAPSGSEYGPVRSGETLWGIARDWSRGSGMNINQVMLAIQRENPDAFLQDNINLLKRGAILRMPSVSDVDLVSAAAAYREVVAQEEVFRGRAAVPTAASPETPLLARESAAIAVAEEEQEPAVAEEVPAAVEEEPAAAGEDPAAAEAADQAVAEEPAVAETVPEQDLLELVPPSEASELDSASGFEESPGKAGADVAAQALREDLARTEEELITQQQQNAYLEERIRELESQLETGDEGRVADADLANMEDRLREQRQAPVQTPREETRPWYARMGVWLIGLLVLAAAFVGWLVSRREMGRGAAVAGAPDSLREIKSEAEDVLRVLADDREQQPGNDASKAPGKPEAPADKAPPARPGADDDAELLDEESSDPEIQLDLARAYISMGDKEAARVILQEVVNNGSDAQQAEARKMLGFL